MCSPVIIKPFARPIQNNNYKYPDGINNPEIETIMQWSEQEWCLCVNDLVTAMPCCKEKYYANGMYKIKMHYIIKKRNTSIQR